MGWSRKKYQVQAESVGEVPRVITRPKKECNFEISRRSLAQRGRMEKNHGMGNGRQVDRMLAAMEEMNFIAWSIPGARPQSAARSCPFGAGYSDHPASGAFEGSLANGMVRRRDECGD